MIVITGFSEAYMLRIVTIMLFVVSIVCSVLMFRWVVGVDGVVEVDGVVCVVCVDNSEDSEQPSKCKPSTKAVVITFSDKTPPRHLIHDKTPSCLFCYICFYFNIYCLLFCCFSGLKLLKFCISQKFL